MEPCSEPVVARIDGAPGTLPVNVWAWPEAVCKESGTFKEDSLRCPCVGLSMLNDRELIDLTPNPRSRWERLWDPAVVPSCCPYRPPTLPNPIAWGYWVLVHAPVFDNLGFAVHFLQENTLQFLFPDAWDMRYRPLVTHTFYVLPVLVPVMIHFVRRRIDGLTFMTSSFPPLHRPTIVLSNRFPTRQLRQVPSRRACCCTLPSIFIRLHDLGFLSSSTSSVDHDTLYSSNHTSQITSIYYCDDSSSSE